MSCLSGFYLSEQIQFVSVLCNCYLCPGQDASQAAALFDQHSVPNEDSVLCVKGRERHTSRRQNVVSGWIPQRTYWHQSH